MISFLYDDAAVDVSRITGIPWAYQQFESGGASRPCINLLDLDWWDRMRVTFAVIAGEYFVQHYMEGHGGDDRLDSPVVVSVPDSETYEETVNAA